MLNTILIVDDSATARMVIKRCIEIAGYSNATFIEAKDGVQALEKVEENKIDLVSTDLTMPNMDGKTLLKHLRANPKLTYIPIIVITSSGSESIKKDLLKLNANVVLNKPISPAVIARELNKIEKNPSWGM